MMKSVCGLLFLAATAVGAQTRTIEAAPILEIKQYQEPFGNVAGVATLRDGALVVGDASNLQIYVFDASGKPVTALGRRGGGPGEFRHLGWVGICGADSVVVLDQALNRLTTVYHGKIAGTGPAKAPGPGGYQTDNRQTAYGVYCGSTGAKVLIGWPTGGVPENEGPHRSPVNLGVAKPGALWYSRFGV